MLGSWGPLRRIQGYRSVQKNADLITVEIYVQQGTTINNQFFIYGPQSEIIYIFGYLGGPGGGGGVFYDQNRPILPPDYPRTHINVYIK